MTKNLSKSQRRKERHLQKQESLNGSTIVKVERVFGRVGPDQVRIYTKEGKVDITLTCVHPMAKELWEYMFKNGRTSMFCKAVVIGERNLQSVQPKALWDQGW
jgi:hypothetical protein